MTSPADDEPVPRLPRGRGLKLDGAMLMRVGMTLALLVMVVITARPCGDAASRFVTGFGSGSGGSAASALPRPDNVDVPTTPLATPTGAELGRDYVQLRPGMTDAEVKAAIDAARQKARTAPAPTPPAAPAPAAPAPTPPAAPAPTPASPRPAPPAP